jgi:hypothetical protein
MTKERIKWAAIVAAVLFGIVAWHEWRYAQDHPHAYGPANYIVLVAIGGVVLAAAVFSGTRGIRAQGRQSSTP